MMLGGGDAVFGGVVTAAGLGPEAASGRGPEANLSLSAITSYLLHVLINVLAAVALGAPLQSSVASEPGSFFSAVSALRPELKTERTRDAPFSPRAAT